MGTLVTLVLGTFAAQQGSGWEWAQHMHTNRQGPNAYPVEVPWTPLAASRNRRALTTLLSYLNNWGSVTDQTTFVQVGTHPHVQLCRGVNFTGRIYRNDGHPTAVMVTFRKISRPPV